MPLSEIRPQGVYQTPLFSLQPPVRESDVGKFDPKKYALLTAGFLGVSVPLILWGRPRSLRVVAESELLKAALAKVNPKQIGEDVAYLASDALEGRGTPSEGLTKAGQHVIARLEKLGWQPGGPAGYEYKYKLWRAGLDSRRTAVHLRFRGQRMGLKFGEDYYYRSLTRTQGPIDFHLPTKESLVYAGSGRKADLSKINVRGKWLVCDDVGLPASERRRNAIEAGALGLLMLPPKGKLDPRYLKALETGLETAKSRGEVIYSPHHPIDEVVLSPEAANRVRQKMGNQLGSVTMGGGVPIQVGRRPVRIGLTRIGAAPTGSVREIEASNYVGFFPGSDPELSKEVVIISAHLDHLGKRMGRIYPGADDNASGSSALLALAEAIPELKPKRSILLLWTTGEELGLLGSEAWVRNPWLPGGRRAVANINIDMVGRNAAEELLMTPTSRLGEHYNGISRRIEQTASQEGILRLRSADQYWERSDHYPFASRLKIPVAFITNDTHPDYHRPTDIAAKIEPELIALRTRLVVRVLDDLRGEI
ncbi:MAG: M28 family peptidase [Deltaproteobacteria bacterium]|nr:M28 family peptidase [Deltaproteobacteria bacterium]